MRDSSPKLKRWLGAACLGLMVVGSTGCSITSGLARQINKSECCDEFMIDYRNRALAEKAWHCQKDSFGSQRYMKDFKAGFIAGYIDIASGGYGCCPCVAPDNYWGWRYQSAQGQNAINAWYAGFPLGVRAAEQDGIGHWQQMQTHCPAQQPYTGMPTEAVADPFYPGETIQPGESIDPQIMPHDAIELDAEPVPMLEIDSVQNETGNAFQVTELTPATGKSDDELVYRFDVAQRPESDPPSFNAPVQASPDTAVETEIRETATGELEFSFE